MSPKARNRAVLAIAVVGLASPVIALAIALYVGYSTSPCDHQVVREFPSPNGQRAAIVILTNCGATTPFVSSVAIKNPGDDLDFDRNRIFSVKDENDIDVVWDGNAAMTVVYDTPALIYLQIVIWRAQRISYRERWKP